VDVDREAEARRCSARWTGRTPPSTTCSSEATARTWRTLEVLQAPIHYDYRDLRHTPAQLRALFASMGWRQVVAFQTRNPLHRAHLELTPGRPGTRGEPADPPVVGMTKPGDVDHYTRSGATRRSCRATARHGAAVAAAAGDAHGRPREAVWHAIIRKNHGVTHFIAGRDHAGPGNDSKGAPFYGPYEAQDLLRKHEAELGVSLVTFRQMVYVEDRDEYVPDDEVPQGLGCCPSPARSSAAG